MKPLPIILLLPILFVLASCASPKKGSDAIATYQAALAQADTTGKATLFQRGSPEEKAAIDRFENFLSEMTVEKIKNQTKEVYAANAYLNDTLKTLQGAAEIEAYFLGTMKNAESVIVRFDDVAESKGNYYFRWVMDVKLKKFKKGQTIRTIGVTHIRFDQNGLVTLHQDYWDPAAGLYEHLPVVGGMIRWVKGRL